MRTICNSFQGKVVIQPSASLQHVPYDVALETKLPGTLRNVLSFALKKLTEVNLVARLTKAGGVNYPSSNLCVCEDGDPNIGYQVAILEQWRRGRSLRPRGGTSTQQIFPMIAFVTASQLFKSLT